MLRTNVCKRRRAGRHREERSSHVLLYLAGAIADNQVNFALNIWYYIYKLYLIANWYN